MFFVALIYYPSKTNFPSTFALESKKKAYSSSKVEFVLVFHFYPFNIRRSGKENANKKDGF